MDAQQRDAAANIAAQILTLLPDDEDAPAITVSISSLSELVGLLQEAEKNLQEAQARIVEQNTTREGIADRTREEIATYLENVSNTNWKHPADRTYAAALVRDPNNVPTTRPRPIADNPQA